ncbi:hypothetical protein PVK06_016657 [Gossypium arboreum]|uniref:Uncharacterized protein n=1 Tax=Gossypium arboreum TaxID=29729 RepID=A0ABR0Q0J2_GOSAR|nr:hypothetical protein PVK06_016657 [Gossypium arboreum]
MELDELETSYSSTEMYCTELNIHNTCERDMRSEEKLCEKNERKETLNGKSRLDDPLLMRENIYEEFVDPLRGAQLVHSTYDKDSFFQEFVDPLRGAQLVHSTYDKDSFLYVQPNTRFKDKSFRGKEE